LRERGGGERGDVRRSYRYTNMCTMQIVMNAMAIIIEEVQDRGRRRAPRQFGREGAPMLW